MSCGFRPDSGHRPGFNWRGFHRRGSEGPDREFDFMPHGGEGFGFGGGFGVRRPLRFIAYKLELDEQQVAELAKLLDQIKTERAQVEVDDRRALSDFADALSGDTFDAAKVGAAGERRVASAARLRDAVNQFLSSVHAILRPDQRAKLAYLIRTGALSV